MRQFLGFLVTAFLVGNSAYAYELAKDSTGTPVRWRSNKVHFSVSTHTFKTVDHKDALKAARAAAATMAQVMPGVKVQVDAGNSDGVGYDFNGKHNQNDIVMLESWDLRPNAIASTILTLDRNSHAVIDADIALNASSKLFAVLADDSNPGGIVHDIQNTLTHEMGHALGLAHSPDVEEAVMYPTAPPGEVTKRQLSNDDIEALVKLYEVTDASTGGAAQDEEPAQGCSATGNASPASLAALLMMLGALRAKVRRAATVRARKVSGTIAAGLLVAVVGSSQTAFAGEELQVTADPQMMATVEVVSQKTLAPPAGSRMLTTQLTLKVRWCAKGNCPQQMSVTVPGGTWGNLEQRVEGLEVPAVGAVVGVEVPKLNGASKAQWAQLYRLESEVDLKAFVGTLTRFNK